MVRGDQVRLAATPHTSSDAAYSFASTHSGGPIDEWLIAAMDDDSVSDLQLTEYIRAGSAHLGGITPAQRALIRRLHAHGVLQKDIAALFDVTPSAISHIIRRKVGRNDPPSLHQPRQTGTST